MLLRILGRRHHWELHVRDELVSADGSRWTVDLPTGAMMSRLHAIVIGAFAAAVSACGETVRPAVDAADVADSMADVRLAIDARDGGGNDADALSDTPDVVGDVLSPPFSRLVITEASLDRSDQWESLEASRFAPSGSGIWRQQRSGGCVLEHLQHPVITPFSDSLEVNVLDPPQLPLLAVRRRDSSLRWQGSGSTFDAGARLVILARRSDWPTEWRIERRPPVSVIVREPPQATYFVNPSRPLRFRWSSRGVDAEALVRISVLSFPYNAAADLADQWSLSCEIEAWREELTLTLADHPAFPIPAVIPPPFSVVIRVDTVLTSRETLPNGELVLVDSMANSFFLAPSIER